MHLIFLFIQLAIVTADEAIDDETFLTDADFEHAKSLPEIPDVPVNESAMHTDGLTEGDMLPDSDKPAVFEVNAREKRAVVKGIQFRWPGGRVPYKISKQFTEDQKARIAQALSAVEKAACIDFVEKEAGDNNYVVFKIPNVPQCSAQTGMKGGKQLVNLGVGCFEKGIILHEVMHALGFLHEHNRPDRDDHITIIESNVEDRLKSIDFHFFCHACSLCGEITFHIFLFRKYKVRDEREFTKYKEEDVEIVGAYDYSSIMHYGETYNGKLDVGDGALWSAKPMQTIRPKKEGVTIGQKVGLSAGDIQKLHKVYECPPDCEDLVAEECKNIQEGSCTFFVALACQKTCQLCLESTEECYDAAVEGCDGVLKKGLCTQRSTRLSCARSCGLCQDCKDTAPGGCENVMTDGRCTDPAIRRGCQKSCGFCEECKDTAPRGCPGTALANLCHDFPQAEEGCRKTCNFCTKSSKGRCMKDYVVRGGTPHGACIEKRVRKRCPDMCNDLLPEPAQPVGNAKFDDTVNANFPQMQPIFRRLNNNLYTTSEPDDQRL